MFIEFMPHSNRKHLVLFIKGGKHIGPILFFCSLSFSPWIQKWHDLKCTKYVYLKKILFDILIYSSKKVGYNPTAQLDHMRTLAGDLSAHETSETMKW